MGSLDAFPPYRFDETVAGFARAAVGWIYRKSLVTCMPRKTPSPMGAQLALILQMACEKPEKDPRVRSRPGPPSAPGSGPGPLSRPPARSHKLLGADRRSQEIPGRHYFGSGCGRFFLAKSRCTVRGCTTIPQCCAAASASSCQLASGRTRCSVARN